MRISLIKVLQRQPPMLITNIMSDSNFRSSGETTDPIVLNTSNTTLKGVKTQPRDKICPEHRAETVIILDGKAEQVKNVNGFHSCYRCKTMQ